MEKTGEKVLKILKESIIDSFENIKIRDEFKKDYPYIMKTIDCLFKLNTNEENIIKSLLEYYGFNFDDAQHLIAEYKIHKNKGLIFTYRGNFD